MRSMAIGCVVLLLTIAACKKSVEGESKRWTSANHTVDELIVLYPGFKTALEEQRQKARTAMDAAEAVADEKQRISQMSAANTMLTSGFVGQLRDAAQSIKKLREKVLEVSGKAADESDRLTARQAAAQATQVVTQIEDVLARGASDAASAAIVLKKVTADVRAAQDNLARVARMAQDKQQAKEAAQQPAAGETGQAPAQQPAAAAWTCDHCDQSNPAEATTCQNCGAPHP